MTPFAHGWDVAPSVAPQISAGTFSFGDVLREYGFDANGKDHLESALSRAYDGPGLPPVVPNIASTYEGEDGLGFLTEVDGFTRSRDALGNATRIETRTPEVQSPKAPLDLVFDAHSRLRRATRSDGVVVEYGYRADGVLLSRKRTCGSTPPVGCQNTTRLYLYDGMLLLEEVELGSTAAQDQVMARYYYADEGEVPVAGDFRMGPGPAGLVRLYYVVDRQGSVLGLVDEGGAWVERVRYDVWGTPVFEHADALAPEVSQVGTDSASGDVVIVMSEPVVPRAVLPAAPNQNLALEAVDLSSEVIFEDALGQEVPGKVTVDLDAVDDAGVPVGSVLRWTPLAAVVVGALLTLRVAEGAVVDDYGLRNAAVAQAVTYGPAQSFVGVAPGSTQAGLQSQSATGNRLLFQSHFWDADVGLYHMRARMFDPRSGMFLSRDPSGYADSVNLFAPMRWDMVNHRDPTGRATLEEQQQQYLRCLELVTGPRDEANAYCIKRVYGSFAAFAGATGSGRALADTNALVNAGLAWAASGVAAASGGAGTAVQGAVGGFTGVLAGGAVSGGLAGAGTLLVSDLFGGEMSSVQDYTEVLIEGAAVGIVVSGVVYAAVGGVGLSIALEKQIRAASMNGRLQLRTPSGRIVTPRASQAGMVILPGAKSGAAGGGATGQRTVIGKLKDLTNLRSGENTLLKHLPDQGSVRANWGQNSGVLRQEMAKGRPIRDASVNPATGELIRYRGSFLDAERNLLQSRGWTYDPGTRLWSPP